jgi:glycerol-3-phosphate acyltransferase PlsY
MTITAAASVVGAYLLGAIPTSYLVARFLRGVDIRESGSGNVGASNLSEHVGRWIGITVGLFDLIVKAIVPIFLAQFFDQSLTVQAAVGLAAVMGHNWSPYLQMTGGRGISTVIGIMVAFLMWPEIVIGLVLVGLVGTLWLKDMALWMFVMILALPVMAYLFDFFDLFERDLTIVILFGCLAIALLAKRLTANWERPEQGYNWRVFLYRLLWDRDVRRQEEWTRRGIEGKAV